MSDAIRCDACGGYSDSRFGWVAVTSIASGLPLENVMPMFEVCPACAKPIYAAFLGLSGDNENTRVLAPEEHDVESPTFLPGKGLVTVYDPLAPTQSGEGG